MLDIRNLNARVEGADILRNLSLSIKPGEVHAIMGPNGAGKSTLGNVLSGRPGYEVTSGEVRFKGKDLLEMEIEERAREGLFLAFQYPVEIPGVSNMEFLKAAVDARRKHLGLEEMSSFDFMKLARETSKRVSLDAAFLKRGAGIRGDSAAIGEAFRLTGFFFHRHVYEPRGIGEPESRSGLINALRRAMDGSRPVVPADTGEEAI